MPRSPSYVVRGYQGDRETAARLLFQMGPFATLTGAKKAAQPQADAAKRGVKVYVEPVGTEEIDPTHPRGNPGWAESHPRFDAVSVDQAYKDGQAVLRTGSSKALTVHEAHAVVAREPLTLDTRGRLFTDSTSPAFTGYELVNLSDTLAYHEEQGACAKHGRVNCSVCWDETEYPLADEEDAEIAAALAAAPRRPNPDTDLPDDPWRYFRQVPGAVLLPVSKLVPIRARPTGIDNAARYMRMAYDGTMERRKPISVAPLGDGRYTVCDGNSTFANAQAAGWGSIPAVVIASCESEMAHNPRRYGRIVTYKDIHDSVLMGIPPKYRGRVALARAPRGGVVIYSENIQPHEGAEIIGALRAKDAWNAASWTVETGAGEYLGMPVIATVRPTLTSDVPLDNPSASDKPGNVRCPTCGASPGQPCYDGAARLRFAHAARCDAASTAAMLTARTRTSNPAVTIHSEITPASYPAIFGKSPRGIPEVDDPYGHGECTGDRCDEQIEETSLRDQFATILRTRDAYLPRMQHVMGMLRELAPTAKVLGRVKTPYSLIQKLVRSFVTQPGKGYKVAEDCKSQGAPMGVPLQLKDFAGTKIIGKDRAELNKVRAALLRAFAGSLIESEDKYKEEEARGRAGDPNKPRLGYNAYHLVVLDNGLPVEIIMQTKRIEALGHASHEPYKNDRLNLPAYIRWVDLVNAADKGDRAAAAKVDPLLATHEGQERIEREITLALANPRRWNPTEPDVLLEVSDPAGWAE